MTQFRTNRYAASCYRCHLHVPANAGRLEQSGGKWVVRCATKCEVRAKPAPVARAVGDLSGVYALFEKARGHLKAPAIVLGVPEANLTIRINVAGPQAKVPGSLTVLGERDDAGERPWYGRILKDGAWQASRDAQTSVAAILARLQAFAQNPAAVASEHGILTGRCCFCNIRLTDPRSTAVGYGETCAGHWGVPWGENPAGFAEPPGVTSAEVLTSRSTGLDSLIARVSSSRREVA